MKYKGSEKLIVYVIAYEPKSARSPLEDAVTPKG